MAVRYSFGLGFGGRRLARRGRGWRRSRGCYGGRFRVGFTDEVYGVWFIVESGAWRMFVVFRVVYVGVV